MGGGAGFEGGEGGGGGGGGGEGEEGGGCEVRVGVGDALGGGVSVLCSSMPGCRSDWGRG